MSGELKGRVALVSGGGRGIGLAIAKDLAARGAKVLIADPGTGIDGTGADPKVAADAAADIGGMAFPQSIASPEAAQQAVKLAVDQLGGIDIVVNNAGALDLRPTSALPPKNFRRLLEVNVEGPFAVVQAALPHLRKSDNAHIVNVSPPVNLAPAWVGAHTGHTVGKYAESLLTIGWAAEFASIPIAVNSLWPATTVASTGMLVAMGEAVKEQARDPRVMADALQALVTRSTDCTGNFYTDEQILREEGVTDLTGYRLAASEEDLVPNFYLESTPLPTL